MFKATAKLYDPRQKVLAEHSALGSTVILASEAEEVTGRSFPRSAAADRVGFDRNRGDAGRRISAGRARADEPPLVGLYGRNEAL
jgi:hypothetical protein